MNDSIIEAIDSHIADLQKARAILSGTTDVLAGLKKTGRGRPKGSKNAPKTLVKAKRVLSEEGRARISAAMKKRHALKKKAAKKAEAEAAQD